MKLNQNVSGRDPRCQGFQKTPSVKPGTISAADMFKNAQSDNVIWTWIIRIVNALVTYLGFVLILDPLRVIADVVPVVGNVLGTGAAAGCRQRGCGSAACACAGPGATCVPM